MKFNIIIDIHSEAQTRRTAGQAQKDHNEFTRVRKIR
jgi:hypothetical protein